MVNDTFEILNERLERLIVLRIEDKPDLHYLVAKKYDRSKGRDYACILDLISERIAAIEGKKRKPSATDIIPAFAKRAGEGGSADSVGPPYSTSSTSSEASDERPRGSALKSSSRDTSHTSLQSALSAPNSRHNSARKNRDGIVRRISISTPGDEDAASNSGSSSTGDDDITVTEDSGLLRELSSVCYQRLISPSIVGTIPGSADLAVGSMVMGTSMFGSSTSAADLVRSLEKVRPPSTLSSASKGPLIYASDRALISSPFSGSNGSGHGSPTSHSTAVPSYSGLSSAASGSVEHPSAVNLLSHSESVTNLSSSLSNSHHKRNRQAQDDAVADTTHSYQYNERLGGLDGQTPRKRAATFSVSEPYPYYSQVDQNPIATLTWLASMEDEEVDVARSLYELRGNGGSSLFDGRGLSGGSSSTSNNIPGGGALGLALSLGLGSSSLDPRFGSDSGSNLHSYVPYRNEGGQDYEADDYYQEQDEGDLEDDDEDDGEEYAHYHSALRQGFNYAGSFEHNGEYCFTSHNFQGINTQQSPVPLQCLSGKLYQSTLGFNSLQGGINGTGLASGGTFSRPRSSSMSMIDRSEAAWAILGSTGGYRSKSKSCVVPFRLATCTDIAIHLCSVDPLSMALKKYHERGGSANAAASGFVGIYSPEDRKSRIMRFLEKRKRRMWTKKVKYDVRKNFADSRVRVKGRFVKKQEEDGDALNTSAASFDGADSSLNHSYSSHHADLDDEEEEEDDGPSEPPSRRGSVDISKNSSALNLKLKFTKAATPGSGRKKEKVEVVKSEASKHDLKLTISTRRRRNSSVGDLEGAGVPLVAASSDDAGVTSSESSTKGHGDSPSSAMAAKLERATLSSAVKAAPVY